MIEIIPTPQEQLLKDIAAFLNKAKIPYMITGSLSVIRYGRIRASHDIDFILEAPTSEDKRIKEVFQQLPRKEFVVDPIQVQYAVTDTTQFNVFHLPTALKLDFWILKNTPFDKERFKRRKELSVYGTKIAFSSPEDTILKKLLWYEDSKIEKHLIDAAFVYQIQEKNLDKKYLLTWSKNHKTQKLLSELADINLDLYY